MLCIENQVSFRKCISWTHSNYLTIFVFLFLFCVKCTPRIHFFAKLKLRTKRTADSSWCQQSFFCGLLRSGNVSDTVRVYLVFKRQTSNLYCIKRSAHDRIRKERKRLIEKIITEQYTETECKECGKQQNPTATHNRRRRCLESVFPRRIEVGAGGGKGGGTGGGKGEGMNTRRGKGRLERERKDVQSMYPRVSSSLPVSPPWNRKCPPSIPSPGESNALF